jgi:hypothetical protein
VGCFREVEYILKGQASKKSTVKVFFLGWGKIHFEMKIIHLQILHTISTGNFSSLTRYIWIDIVKEIQLLDQWANFLRC